MPWRDLHICPHELRRDFGVDSVAITAQPSQAGGSLINQRECAGFNRPPALIAAEEPVSKYTVLRELSVLPASL